MNERLKEHKQRAFNSKKLLDSAMAKHRVESSHNYNVNVEVSHSAKKGRLLDRSEEYEAVLAHEMEPLSILNDVQHTFMNSFISFMITHQASTGINNIDNTDDDTFVNAPQ